MNQKLVKLQQDKGTDITIISEETLEKITHTENGQNLLQSTLCFRCKIENKKPNS